MSVLINNAATVIIVVALAALIFLAIRKIIKDKKSGIGACGRKCSECEKMQNGECSDGYSKSE